MKVLELFAGSKSVGNIAKELGHEVFSVDITGFSGINLFKDIEFLTIEDIPFIPDVIWGSPPCTTYSIAAISSHRDGTIAISDFAKKSDRLLENTVRIINYFKSINSSLKFFIENPVGMMRKMPILKQFERASITYCSYGDIRMKPTDIFSNHIYSIFNQDGWKPRPMCWNNNPFCKHEKSPRGSKTGTQGLKNDYERSKIPKGLIKEIFDSL